MLRIRYFGIGPEPLQLYQQYITNKMSRYNDNFIAIIHNNILPYTTIYTNIIDAADK